MDRINKIKLNTGMGLKGSYRMIALPALEILSHPDLDPESRKELIRMRLEDYGNGLLVPSKEILTQNLIVNNPDHGLRLIFQHLAGDTLYPLPLNKAAIGTGTNVPSAADTALQTPFLVGGITNWIEKVDASVTSLGVLVRFFMTDAELTNGFYTEFAPYSEDKLFARSLIQGGYTKAASTDTLVEYNIFASTVS